MCVYRNFTFEDVHVEGTRAIAEAAMEAGVSRFVQVSALNASEDSPSKFLQTKVMNKKMGHSQC
jgi:NADH dehydrogenase (ubiquinone) 1 alpha subcomplex subunit 9